MLPIPFPPRFTAYHMQPTSVNLIQTSLHALERTAPLENVRIHLPWQIVGLPPNVTPSAISDIRSVGQFFFTDGKRQRISKKGNYVLSAPRGGQGYNKKGVISVL